MRGLPEDAFTQAAFPVGMGDWAPLPARDASKARALDVSGGTGFASAQLAQMGCEVVRLDESEEMLGIARQQAEGASVEGLRCGWSSLRLRATYR
jgi:2-polyprenyl-3-methyl-5-hydroxy-6-metoxy-1,4-benzoquinol methylase